MGKYNSIFDVLGPIMVGPSSSHTAGASRLGKIARYIADGDIRSVKITLYGSFAETAKGHGTEMALVAGILGMEPDDEKLRYSLLIATERGIDISFEKDYISGLHPNTAKFSIEKSDGSYITVTGSSIGGGAVIVNAIDAFNVELTGDYFTIVTKHVDKKGIISKVTTLLAENNINIGNMKVRRDNSKNEASMIIETDEIVSNEVLEKIKGLEEMIFVIEIKPVRENKNV
ncbi:MAG: L-serine ammonia-lyase, iron-sulfur-dependent subunit beta [Euryarchaeota archaeon]|nr:L-serine ammonia-lyase, iron-sulfur-dependent subunit beta [Euryarchaeota archaeon]MBV1756752.1 L-serine ammonia-lyase, iron-sulfur-dependent subunit beta [Dethiosulfatibacter sp.]